MNEWMNNRVRIKVSIRVSFATGALGSTVGHPSNSWWASCSYMHHERNSAIAVLCNQWFGGSMGCMTNWEWWQTFTATDEDERHLCRCAFCSCLFVFGYLFIVVVYFNFRKAILFLSRVVVVGRGIGDYGSLVTCDEHADIFSAARKCP